MITQLPWVTSIIPHGKIHPSAHTTVYPIMSAHHITNRATQTSATVPGGVTTFSKGIKIGIIIGIVVIGILTIVGCGLGMLSVRNFHRRRKIRRQERNSELYKLESEAKRWKGRHKGRRESGLWDNLKIKAMDEEERGVEMGNVEVREGPEGAVRETQDRETTNIGHDSGTNRNTDASREVVS
jgi:hypothetical protein